MERGRASCAVGPIKLQRPWKGQEWGWEEKVEKWTNGNKNAKIVVYCSSGYRAAWAQTTLLKGGYTNVVNAGGVLNMFDTIESFCPASLDDECAVIPYLARI